MGFKTGDLEAIFMEDMTMNKYLKTMFILVTIFFIASFFETNNFMAFGWGISISFLYLLYKGAEEELNKEVLKRC